jgi:hypothetical protein
MLGDGEELELQSEYGLIEDDYHKEDTDENDQQALLTIAGVALTIAVFAFTGIPLPF